MLGDQPLRTSNSSSMGSKGRRFCLPVRHSCSNARAWLRNTPPSLAVAASRGSLRAAPGERGTRLPPGLRTVFSSECAALTAAELPETLGLLWGVLTAAKGGNDPSRGEHALALHVKLPGQPQSGFLTKARQVSRSQANRSRAAPASLLVTFCHELSCPKQQKILRTV